jgi:hypothetical protein
MIKVEGVVQGGGVCAVYYARTLPFYLIEDCEVVL